LHCACCPCPHTTTSTALPLLSSIRHEGFGGRLRNAFHAGHTHIFLLLGSVLIFGFAPAGLGWLGLSRVRSRCMRPSLSPCLILFVLLSFWLWEPGWAPPIRSGFEVELDSYIVYIGGRSFGYLLPRDHALSTMNSGLGGTGPN